MAAILVAFVNLPVEEVSAVHKEHLALHVGIDAGLGVVEKVLQVGPVANEISANNIHMALKKYHSTCSCYH